MAQDRHAHSAARRRVHLCAEPLESRSLLSTTGSAAQAVAAVAIQVPGDYISQQSTALDVTLVRTIGKGHGHAQAPLTVDFSAQPGVLPGGLAKDLASSGQAFSPVSLPVTFPAGATTTTAVVPMNPATTDAGLVPIVLSVTPQGAPAPSAPRPSISPAGPRRSHR